jgi:hypothetical protein
MMMAQQQMQSMESLMSAHFSKYGVLDVRSMTSPYRGVASTSSVSSPFSLSMTPRVTTHGAAISPPLLSAHAHSGKSDDSTNSNNSNSGTRSNKAPDTPPLSDNRHSLGLDALGSPPINEASRSDINRRLSELQVRVMNIGLRSPTQAHRGIANEDDDDDDDDGDDDEGSGNGQENSLWSRLQMKLNSTATAAAATRATTATSKSAPATKRKEMSPHTLEKSPSSTRTRSSRARVLQEVTNTF